MNRIAILIGSPLSDNNPDYLSGVRYDIDNFYNFLKSSTGGAWSDEEIVYLKNPTIQHFATVKQKYSGRDFAFVYFSGHGFYSQKIDDQVLHLNDNEKIKSSHFLNFASKQITLFDACRVFSDWSNFLGAIEKPDLVYDFKNPEQAKFNYLSQIQRVDSGQAILFSTQQGNTSSEDPNNGGFFSSSILLAASKFAKNQQNEQILNIYNAFKNANQIIHSAYTTDQEPKIKPTTEAALFLPFAVKPYSQIQKQYATIQQPSQQTTDDDTWKWIAGGVAVGLGVFLLLRKK